jgi:hypothetical protein
MRCRSWAIITSPKRDDPIYASERFTIFLPQSGFVQQAITTTIAVCCTVPFEIMGNERHVAAAGRK